MRLLGEGRACLVFDLGGRKVLRRYRDPEADAQPEARVMEWAARVGVPVPRVHDACGPDLVLDRVHGPTMLADLLAEPGRAEQHAVTLARLHSSLDAAPPPPWAATPADSHEPPRDAYLLHGDLHPGNVLLSADGPVLIDWTNHGVGPRSLDVALTWTVLAAFAPPEVHADAALAEAARVLIEVFRGSVDRIAAEEMLPRAVEIRLADQGTTAEERKLLHRLLEGPV